MPAYVAGGVGFDHEVEVARVHVGGDGGVGADDFFSFGDGAGFGVGDVEVGGEGDVLADGQAEDVGGRGQGEAVDGGVVAGAGDLADGVLLEGVWVEGFFRFWGGGG
jgi:hypothetical protein